MVNRVLKCAAVGILLLAPASAYAGFGDPNSERDRNRAARRQRFAERHSADRKGLVARRLASRLGLARRLASRLGLARLRLAGRLRLAPLLARLLRPPALQLTTIDRDGKAAGFPSGGFFM